MSISGLLKTMHLAELLQWVKFGQKTGTLVFERDTVVKKIFIEDGLVISASSNDPKEYLGQVLLSFGTIDENILQKAFQNQITSGKLIGKILCEDFKIPEKQVIQSLRLKIEETIYNLFLWEDGTFIYNDGIAQVNDHDRLDTAITIDQVTFEGARRHDEYKEFRKQVPSDEIVFQKLKKDIEPLKEELFAERIFQLIDGSRSIKRIFLESRVPATKGYEVFSKLLWGHFIEIIKKSPSVERKDRESEQPGLENAMALFKTKNYEMAYQSLETFLKKEPKNEEAKTLFKVVREAYQKHLLNICPETAIPRLRTDISQLNEKILNSKEGFMASRINGQWDVKSLIMVSPLGELESLKILKRLLDANMIELKR